MKRLVIIAVVLVGAACPRPTPSPTGDAAVVEEQDASMPDAAMGLDAAVGVDVPRPDSGPGCGDVPVEGRCEGEVLRYCDDGRLKESDCAERDRRCALQTDLGGYWCVGGVGASCEVIETDACEQGLFCEQQQCAGAADGGVDGGVGDAGVLTDAAVGLDAAVGVDAAVELDAAVGMDAADHADGAVNDAG